MKKLTMFVLAAGLVMSSFTEASAGEFKPNAQFINQFSGGNSGSHYNTRWNIGNDEHFQGILRLRIGFDYIASENLSATFLTQIGVPNAEGMYGNNNTSDQSTFDGYLDNVMVRLAYVDWMLPTTAVKVRMGFQPFALPAFTFGSGVLDTRGAGVTIAAPINENIAMSAFWTRAASNDANVSNFINRGGDDADIFALTADFKYDGFRVAPWAMYLMAGRNVDKMTRSLNSLPYMGNGVSTDIWYAGIATELTMFDPFRFALDAYYSSVSWEDGLNTNYDSQNGFLVNAVASYRTNWGTPALKGWYSSGDDKTGDVPKYGRPATIAGLFYPTTILFYDFELNGGLANHLNGDPAGTMGAIVEWAGLSFVDKLSHILRVGYIVGTNDLGPLGTGTLTYMSTEDSVIEIDLNTRYQMYKNLTTRLDFGYLMTDFNKEFFNNEDEDIFRASLSFVYSF